MKVFLLIIVFVFDICSLKAQILKGKVLDSNNVPIEYASVLLQQRKDSSFVKGTISNEKGVFSLSYIGSIKDYILKISYLGYKPQTFSLSSDTASNIYKLNPSTVMLGDVVIKGQRKSIRKIKGGICVCISDSYLKNVGNALDILGHLPLVVNNNDEILIMGKGKPLIYIDNRLVNNKGEVERLYSKDINKIDIINTPGSEYPASAKAVIKIYTSKAKTNGLSIDLQTSITRKERYSEYLNGNIKYQINSLNFFLNGDILNNKGDYTRKTYYIASIPSSYIGKVRNGKREANFSTGLNFDWNKYLSFGVRYERSATPYGTEYKKLSVNDENVLYVSMDTTNRKSNNHYLNAYATGLLYSLSYELNVDYNKGSFSSLSGINESNKNHPIKYESNDSYEQMAAKLKLSTPLIGKSPMVFGLEYNKTIFNSLQNVLNGNDELDLSDATNRNYQSLYGAFWECNYKWHH